MRPKKIVLIVIDSLRRDHLGCYGYKRDTSPNIDALARGGIRFKNTFSVSPNTVSSIASIFTSKYPSNHSIGFNPDEKLNPELDRTLAAILKINNYKTAAFSGSSKLVGLNSGIDTFEDGPERSDCQIINEQIFRWIDENHRDDFFMFIHYFDLNGPFLNSGTYKNTFMEDEFYGNSEYLNDISDNEPAFNSIPCSKILNQVSDGENNIISFENDIRYYKAQYDGCIRNLDENIKNLIEKLKVLKIYEDALIVITSDHGIAFGENNVFLYHGLSVTLDQIAVPLILKPHKGWNVKSGTINVPASIMDIMPTILSLCEINYDGFGMDGHSLGKIINDEDNVLKERILTSENESQYALIYPGGLIEFKKKDTRKSSFYPSISPLIDSLNSKKYYWDTGYEYNLNLPFDQYQRYKIIADIVNKFRNSHEGFKILEVGASFEGNLKKFLPNDSIYFLDKEYPPEYSKKNNYIVGDITKMNISESYDFVVSLDVYEHIHPNARERFIDTLLKASKIASIIAAPFDTKGVREHEVIANEVYKLSHGYEHVWLHEHIQNGLPSLSYTLELIKKSGFDFFVIPNGSLPRWFEMISTYLLTEGMPEFSKGMEEINEFYNKNFYEYDNIDPAYRQVIVVTKNDPISDVKDIFAKNPDSDNNFNVNNNILHGFLKKFKEIYDIHLYKELIEKRAQNAELTKQVSGLNSDIKDRNEKIADLDAQLKEKTAKLDFSNFELSCIRSSFTWRTVMTLERLYLGLKSAIFSPKQFIKKYHNKIKRLYFAAKSSLQEEGLRILIIRSKNFLLYGEGVLDKKEILNRKKGINFGESVYDLKNIDPNFKPKISVIVPNYNHEKFLRQRLDSIYSQTYPNYEVILLDDNSTDNSREILIEYANKYKENTKYIFNESNSGSVFNQWKRGIEEANGELIWIAESDDYCTDNFISSLFPFFSDESVMIAYCRSIFEKNGTQIWDIESYLADIDQNKWKSDFIETAHRIVKYAMGKKNIIPNVSSAMFRNPGKMSLLDDEKWKSLRFCGDWVFYLYIMRGGAIAYTTKAINYFRQHENNTSTKLQGNDIYYIEHEYVAMKIAELYAVSPEIFDDQKKMLQDYWKLRRKTYTEDAFDACYNIKKIKEHQKCRKPNIAMFGYSFAAGGGETFPIILANVLHENGYGITFFDCDRDARVEGVRKMLKQSIPVIKLSDLSKITLFVNSMGIEILHSHHAWVDSNINIMTEHMPGCSHMVTLHGMYEMLEESRLEAILPGLCAGVDQWVYTTEKNTEAFKRLNLYNENKFVNIGNALVRSDINTISRETLNIDKDAFVLCLVSRAVREKGWEEAIRCVGKARSQSGRDIQLIIIGDGNEKKRLQNKAPSYVKFLGFKSNIRDYFAMAEMGFLPSRFKGESFPLTIIDCLFAGKPVIASNIGEISNMLRIEGEKYAGALFDLNNWTIPEKELTALIIKCATDVEFYNAMLAEVENAARRFDINNVFIKYCECYDKLSKFRN